MHSIGPRPTTRIESLDVFRGFTIALMILVNSPGNSTPFPILQHAAWNGCTLADLVFPFFVMIVGISIVIAFTNLQFKGVCNATLLQKIIRRSIDIFLLGLLLNAFPNHFDPHTLRILGVLQRIALCYFFAAILFLTTRVQTQAFITLIILIFYAVVMKETEPYTQIGNFDQMILGSKHLYTQTFDPEGLLSTIPAIASALMGNLIGYFLISGLPQKKIATHMLFAGLLLTLMGWICNYSVPLNKSIWSSSYVIWTTGLGLLLFSCMYYVIEIAHLKKGYGWLSLFGRHSLLVYVLHVLFLKIQTLFLFQNAMGASINLRVYLTEKLFANLTSQWAALCYAIGYTALWWVVLYLFEKWRGRGYFSKQKTIGEAKHDPNN